MKETNKPLKLVIIERDETGNIVGKKEISVNNKEHTIVNRIVNKPNYDCRRSYASLIHDRQRKNNIVEIKEKINLYR